MEAMQREAASPGDIPLASYAAAASVSTIQLTATESKCGNKEQNDHYNPFENRANTSVSDWGALAHLLKGCLGTGILAMPHAFKNAGLVFGALATLVIGCICTHCMSILVDASHHLSRRTRRAHLNFAETARVALETGPMPLRHFARSAGIFVNSSLCATYYSAGVVYTIFTASSMKQFGDAYFADTKWDLRLYIVVLTLPLCALGCVRKLRYLVPCSAVANMCIIVSFFITLYYIFHDLPSLEERKYVADAIQIPVFLSIVIFALEGIGVVMPIENSMKNPGHFLGCPGVLNIAMCVNVALYAFIGFFGYVKYGENALGSVTLNLPPHDVLAQSVQILLTIATFFTFGLQLYVPNDIAWGELKSRVSEKWALVAEYSFRICVVLIIVCVAIAVPNLGPVISLVGALCFSTLGLLCPAIIETVARWRDEGHSWRLAKNAAISVFALLALASGTYTSLLDIVDAYAH